MTTRTPIAIALTLAVMAPVAAAPAAIPNPQSNAAMRKAIRDYARHGIPAATSRRPTSRSTASRPG